MSDVAVVARPTRRLSNSGLGAGLGLLIGLIALGPALRRGYVLTYDMVFVPRQLITPSVLGIDGSVPRAVPNDLLVALLSTTAPADLVQKVLLLAVFVLGGWGVARMLDGPLGATVAVTAYLWNAYVLERLVIGHWGFLLGYAALPWVVAAAVSARDGRRATLARLAFTVALVGLAGSTALVLAVLAALVVTAWPGGGPHRGRRLAILGLVAVGAAAPWLVPSLFRTGGLPADPAGVSAFAARADTPLGAVASVATLGGIWNPAVWPAERGSVVVAGATLVAVLAAVLFGAPRLRDRWDGAGGAVLATGIVGLLLALAGATPGLRAVLDEMVVHVPGGGLLRDGQKLVALAALPLALCAGLAAERAMPRWRQAAWLLAVVPVVLLPSLAWGAQSRLAAVDYPSEWSAVRDVVARHGGDAAVFPFTYYRRFGWNGDRVLLDPMPRNLPGRVVVNDDLPLSARTVRGEDARAARVRDALADSADLPSALAREGISLVVVESDQPDPDGQLTRLADLPVVWRGDRLLVREVPGVRAIRRTDQPPVGLALGALTLVATGVAAFAASRRRDW